MRIGVSASSSQMRGSAVHETVADAVRAEADGFSTYWMAQMSFPDALTVLAVIGGSTSRIELATGVVPTWPRHPLLLAGQALTVQQASGGRLLLGIGVAHKPSIENRFRVPFVTPAKHMDEYLSVLLPSLTERTVDVTGDIWSGHWEFPYTEGVEAPTVMLAALAPRMLQMAGARTAGTVLWLCGPGIIRERIKPAIDAAAADAGNPAPRIAAAAPVVVTKDPDGFRRRIDEEMAAMGALPSYRAVLAAGGAKGPSDVAVAGTEEQVREGIQAYADAGVTDFNAIEHGATPDEVAATRALLVEVQSAQLAKR